MQVYYYKILVSTLSRYNLIRRLATAAVQISPRKFTNVTSVRSAGLSGPTRWRKARLAMPRASTLLWQPESAETTYMLFAATQFTMVRSRTYVERIGAHGRLVGSVEVGR